MNESVISIFVEPSVNSLPGKRKRDIYGNWMREADETPSVDSAESVEQIKLDWRDVIALSIASLETFILPIIVFLAILFLVAVAFAHV